MVLWTGVAEASAVVEVRDVAAAFASSVGFGGQALDDVRLAVSEAFSNAVMHAYDGIVSGAVEVFGAHENRRLEIRVVDHGTGMLPRAESPGLGIGLVMMATVMDGLLVQCTPGGGTTIAMSLARQPTDDAP